MLLGREMATSDFWVKRGEIPLGTLLPYESYEDADSIPMEDIVRIKFDPLDVSLTSRKAMNLLLLGASGDQKCCEESQKVLLADGRYVAIKDIPDYGEVVSCNNDSLLFEPKLYVKAYSGKKSVYRLTTAFGDEILATAEHKFLTNKNEWVTLGDLKERDFVAVSRELNYFGEAQVSPDAVKIIAYMISDGGCKYHLSYTKKDRLMVDDLNISLQKFDCKLKKKKEVRDYQYLIVFNRKRMKHEKTPVRLLLEKYGLFGEKSVDKQFPKELFGMKKDLVKLFLNRLFSGDGCISRKKSRNNYRYTITYSSGSKDLCDSVKHLLLRFGILARTYKRFNKKYKKNYYYVEMQSSLFVKKFIDEIGFFGEKKKKTDKWYADIEALSTRSNTNFDVVPLFKDNRWLGRERALRFDNSLSTSDLFWDRVKCIEYVGERDTYDLQVEDNNNFVCENFVLHNSLLFKIIWGILSKAGFYCLYIDPKSHDAGRAVMKWDKSPRLPPYLEPEGIPLAHYIPDCSKRNIMQIQHHFRKYARRIKDVDQREMWMGLGMSSQAGIATSKLIRRGVTRIGGIKSELKMMEDAGEITSHTLGNAYRVLDYVEDYGYLDDDIKELNLMRTWKDEEKSVVISYNAMSPAILTFDVGLCIYQAKEYYFNKGNRNPIMFFLDDGKFFADEVPNVDYNFAMEQIKEIGFNYRSLGIYNCLAVQSLAIVDEAVAETYNIKLVSPYFSNPDSLKKINIPQKAINYIKDNVLVKDKKNYRVQWLLVDEDNNVIPFFNFTSACSHFTEIYHAKEGEGV